MEEYISKSALLSEIEKLKGKVSDGSSYYNGWQHALRMLELSLSTLEMKEVDLEKEIDDFMAKEWQGIEEDDEPFYDMIKNDLTSVAKHFFELGLKV